MDGSFNGSYRWLLVDASPDVPGVHLRLDSEVTVARRISESRSVHSYVFDGSVCLALKSRGIETENVTEWSRALQILAYCCVHRWELLEVFRPDVERGLRVAPVGSWSVESGVVGAMAGGSSGAWHPSLAVRRLGVGGVPVKAALYVRITALPHLPLLESPRSSLDCTLHL